MSSPDDWGPGSSSTLTAPPSTTKQPAKEPVVVQQYASAAASDNWGPGSEEVKPTADPIKEASKPFDIHAEYAKSYEPVFKAIGADLQIGAHEVKEGQTWFQVLGGKKLPQEADAELADEEARMKPLEDTVQKANVNAPWYKITSPVLRMLPGLGFNMGIGLVGGVGSGVASALIGGGTGTATGAVVGGGTPAEAVTIPGGAVIGTTTGGISGFTLGFNTGMFSAVASTAAGNAYKNFLKKGVPPEEAKVAAVSQGIVDGILNTWGVGKMAASGRKAAVEYLKSPAGRSFVGKHIMAFAESAGLNYKLTATGSVIDLLIQTIEGTRHKDVMPTREQVNNTVTEALINNVPTSFIMAGTFHGAGVATEMIMSRPARPNTIDQGVKDIVDVRNSNPNVVKPDENIAKMPVEQPPPAPVKTLTGRIERVARAAPMNIDQAKDAVKNFAYKVADLEEQRSDAEMNGDIEGADKIDAQINKARTLHAKARKDLRRVTTKVMELELKDVEAQRDAKLEEAAKAQKAHTDAEEVLAQRKQDMKDLDAQLALLHDERSDAEQHEPDAAPTIQGKIDYTQKQRTKLGEGIRKATDKVTKMRLEAEDRQKELEILSVKRKALAGKIQRFNKEDLTQSKAALDVQRARISDRTSGAHPVSKFSHNTESTIRSALNYFDALIREQEAQAEAIKNPTPGNMKAVAKATADAKQHSEHLDVDIASEIEDQTENHNYKTAAEIDQLTDTLRKTIDEGLQERAGEILEFKERVDGIKKRLADIVALKAAGKTDKINYDPTAERARLVTELDNLRLYGNRFGGSIMSFDGLLAIIMQRVKPEERAQLMEELSVRDHVQNEINDRAKQKEALYGYLTKATGKNAEQVAHLVINMENRGGLFDGIQRKGGLRESNGDRPKYLSVVLDEEGKVTGTKTETWHSTRAQALNYLMQIQAAKNDPQLATRLREGNHFTFGDEFANSPDSTENMLKRVLTQDEQNLGKGYVQYLQEENGPRLAKAYKQATGVELPLLEDYAGYAKAEGRSVESTYDDMLVSLGLSPDHTRSKPGTTIERVNTKLPLAPVSILQNTLEAIDNTEHFRNWWEPTRVLNKVFQDPKVKKGIELNFGSGMNKSLRLYIDDLTLGNQRRLAVWGGAINRMIGDAGHVVLSVDPSRYVKHVLGVVNWGLADVGGGKKLPTADLAAGIADYYAHRKEANAFMEQSEALKNRYASFSDELQGVSKQSSVNDLKVNQFKELMGVALKEGDREAVRAGGWALIRYVKAHGGTDAQALRLFEKGFNEIQYSASADMMSNLERDPNYKPITQFTRLPTTLFQQNVQAGREFLNFPTAQNFKNVVRTGLYTHLSQGLFYGVGIANAMLLRQFGLATQKDVDHQILHTAVEMFQGPLPSILTMATTPITTSTENLILNRRDQYFDLNIMPIDIANNTYKMYKDTVTDYQKGDLGSTESNLRIMGDYLRGPNLVMPFKIPTAPANVVIKGIKTITRGGE
jgi:hypothetical protein